MKKKIKHTDEPLGDLSVVRKAYQSVKKRFSRALKNLAA